MMLGLGCKINEVYFRKTDFVLPPHGLFINYLVQIGLELNLISFDLNFQIFHVRAP